MSSKCLDFLDEIFCINSPLMRKKRRCAATAETILRTVWYTLGPATDTGAHSLPQPVPLIHSVPQTLPPPTHSNPCTHTPAWTNQTFGGQLIHSHLHNEAFVTHCPILPKEYTATAHRAHCSTQTRSQEIQASTQNVRFNFPSTYIRPLKHKRGVSERAFNNADNPVRH